jgi:hypothetical protein
VPKRCRTMPDRALEPNSVSVIAASTRPSPASGASSSPRIDGHATPSIPVGSPRITKPPKATVAVLLRIARNVIESTTFYIWTGGRVRGIR